MKTLILLRHAKAVRDNEAPNDRARRLTGRGRRDAQAAGAALIAAGLKPDYTLISSAQRTRETAHLTLSDIVPIDVRVDEALYLSDPETIWRAALACGGETVLVIAHNPGLHALVAHLIAEGHDRSKTARALSANFPTAAFAAFEIAGESLNAAGARLVASWRPDRGDD